MSSVNRFWLAAALLMVGLLAACTGSSAQPAASIPCPSAPPLPTLDTQQVTLGASVYRDTCAACHGADGEGQPAWKVPGPDGVYPAPGQ